MQNVMSEQAHSFSQCTLRGPLSFPREAVTVISAFPTRAGPAGAKQQGDARMRAAGGGEA